MKKLVIAFLFTISLAAVSFGQLSGQLVSTGNVHARIAVLEFSPDPGVTGIDAQGIKALQGAIVKQMKKDPHDKGWIEIPSTSQAVVREFYQKYLGRQVDPADAAEFGKQLGVTHVMTGKVVGYNHTVGGGTLAIKSEIVNVATGKIVWSGTGDASGTDLTKAGQGTLVLSNSNLIKPAVHKLTANLKAADL